MLHASPKGAWFPLLCYVAPLPEGLMSPWHIFTGDIESGGCPGPHLPFAGEPGRPPSGCTHMLPGVRSPSLNAYETHRV